MRIGVLILCRYTSSRLPGKILKPLFGKPILQYILEKIELVVAKDQIVVCTSDQISDDPIFEFCSTENFQCYRGSLENVAERFLKCGLHFQFDYLVRINGDNLFLDRFLLEKMISEAETGNYNLVTNVWGRTYPKGVSIEIVNSDFYRDTLLNKFKDARHFEHVTLYFYEHFNELTGTKNLINQSLPEAAGIQLAIDTQKDFILAEKMISKFEKPHTEYSFAEIFHIWKELNE
jgi:spore coat polysaccharide biosynthesis protein SpsF